MTASGGKYALEGTKIGLQFLQDIADGLPFPVKVAVNVVQRILTLAEAMKSNQDECNLVKDRILRVTLVIVMSIKEGAQQDTESLIIPASLKAKLEDFHSRLIEIERTLDKIKKRTESKGISGFFRSLTLSNDIADALKKCNQTLEWEMKIFEVDTRVDEYIRVAQIAQDVTSVRQDLQSTRNEVSTTRVEVRGVRDEARAAEAMARIETLPRAKNASYRAAQSVAPGSCLEGTRTTVLEEIDVWVKDTSPTACRTLWLSGMAGMGKSAIACSVAEKADNESLLGANYFFSRAGDHDLKSPSLCFPTLAYQLSRFAKDFKTEIAGELSKDPDLPHSKLPDQLKGLITRPLQRVDTSPGRVVLLVLDGLDECEDQGAREIITLLFSQLDCFPFTLKLLVASRPEPHLVSAFHNKPGIHRIALHELDAASAEQDIEHYLRHQLTRLPVTLGIRTLSSGWITEAELHTLAKMAGQLFVYAKTVVRFVGDDRLRDPQYQLKIILKTSHHLETNPFGDIDALYTFILNNAFSSRSPHKFVSRYQHVVGAIIVLVESHPDFDLTALERLLGVPEGEAGEALYHLRSLIVTEPTLRIFHKSFRDFICSPQRCVDQRFYINASEQENAMAVRCLKLMTASLRPGMVTIPEKLRPGWWKKSPEGKVEIRRAFVPELRYACVLWNRHAINTSRELRWETETIQDALEDFTANYLLMWIEAFYWLVDSSTFNFLLGDQDRGWEDLLILGSEIPSVALLRSAIEMALVDCATLQWDPSFIYAVPIPAHQVSGLFFERYGCQASCKVKSLIRPRAFCGWRASGVAFSPDGTRLAVALLDSWLTDTVVRIWGITSNDVVSTSIPHWNSGDAAFTTRFSPDGSRVVASNNGGLACMLDALKGGVLFILNSDRDPGGVGALFSSDGCRVATSGPGMVCLWDAQTGTLVSTLQSDVPSKSFPFATILNPNGSSIASVFKTEPSSIILWEISTGEIKLNILLEKIRASRVRIAFSPDGSLLAYQDRQKIHIRNTLTGTAVSSTNLADIGTQLPGFSGKDYDPAISFSHDGTMILSRAAGRIGVLDLRTGERAAGLGATARGLFAPESQCSYYVAGPHSVVPEVNGTKRSHFYYGPSFFHMVNPSYDSSTRLCILPRQARRIVTWGNKIAFVTEPHAEGMYGEVQQLGLLEVTEE